jgi:hypothetical protein
MEFTLYEKEKLKEKSTWSSRFVKAAIIQMVLAALVTGVLVLAQLGPLNLLSFVMSYKTADTTYAGTWVNFGYIMYIIGVLAIGLTATFYRYFESNISIRNTKLINIFASIHLLLMNIGIVIASWMMMIAGYIGGVAQMSIEWGGTGMDAMKVHESIFQTLVPLGVTNWVAIGILLAVVGILLGSLGLFIQLTRKKEEVK